MYVDEIFAGVAALGARHPLVRPRLCIVVQDDHQRPVLLKREPIQLAGLIQREPIELSGLTKFVSLFK